MMSTTITGPVVVNQAQKRIAYSVGDSVCAAVSNNRSRGDQNPILLGLAADPMQVLIDHGMPEDFLANALPDVKAAFIAHLKSQAETGLQQAGRGRLPRGFFACWGCTIGLGMLLALLGVLITAATFGTGTAALAALVAFIEGFGVAAATAATIANGAVVVGGVGITGGIGALINWICSAIPDTC